MLITYCSNDNSARYGANVFAVEVGLLPYEEVPAGYAHVVPQDVDPDSVFGCPAALVIEDGVVRAKGPAELLVDAIESALSVLEGTTNALIKSVADTDRQNSITIMYNNMSTTDKARAKTYFDWHKSMLARHYATKELIKAAASVEDIAALVGTGTAFSTQYTDLMEAAPYSAVDLESYIH